MIKRHTTFYVNELKPVNFCGKVIGYEANVSGFELPFEIELTKGEHDFNKCIECKKNLNELTKRLKEKFEGNENKKGFPFCCPYHSNLIKVKEFNRDFFVNVPEMVAKKVIYTNQHIINNHNSENWYKKITDHIEWAVESFGQMPTGCGERLYLSDYFFYITDMIKNKDMPTEKKNRILEYLNTYQTPNKNPKTNLNILLSTYQQWLKIFPFEIFYFSHLKQHFEKQLPILNGKPEVNIYSGMVKAKMHTKSSLFETLINLTDNLLTQINGVTLYEKGLITDVNKIKLELVINCRKLKLKQGYKNSSPNEEQRYRNMLKEWFNDEKKFIDEITPLLKALPPQQKETKPETLQETETIKQKVEKAFAFMQGKDPRKYEQILNEPDFQNLINWVTLYFENDFVIPGISKPIHKVITNKGNVIYTFMSFFKELHPSKIRPDSLFNLIKSCFYEYRNDKLENLKKTKKPQYYDQLISKNK
ncbi:MAG TPA: hypothetical protein VMW76_03145 [Bacteroidales bacterium]|nr:hypothetical protein [Bacteroidales bacterium]